MKILNHLRPLLASLAVAACSSSSSSPPAAPQPPIVLVHGAWMGGWAWDDAAAELRSRGRTVTVVELPAHGADPTPLANATLDAYVAKVEAALDAQAAPAVLVAHSFGGVVATRVAEEKPDRIASLVYVAAYVPKEGESLFTLAMQDADSHVGPKLVVDMNAGTAHIPEDALGDIFCADCDAAHADTLRSRYRDEPLGPLATPIHRTDAGWGRVEKHYVFTKRDHAVSYALQQTMTKDVAFASTATLDTSHSPFLASTSAFVTALTGL